MKQLFRYEFRRILTSKYLYICLGISLAFIFLGMLATKLAAQLVVDAGGDASAVVGGGFIGLKTGFESGFFTTFGAIVVAIFISEEYTQETIKNVYSKGYTRTNSYVATYAVSLTATLVLFIVQGLVGMLADAAIYGTMGTAGENYVLSLVGLLLIAIAYHAVFFGISISMRKSGPAVALAIAGPILLTAVVNLVDIFVFKNSQFKLANFWLSGRAGAMEAQDVALDQFGYTVAASLIITAIGLVPSFFVNKKREA